MTDYPDAAWPADPYPGAVPPSSFVHVPGGGLALRGDPDALLAELGKPPMHAAVVADHPPMHGTRF